MRNRNLVNAQAGGATDVKAKLDREARTVQRVARGFNKMAGFLSLMAASAAGAGSQSSRALPIERVLYYLEPDDMGALMISCTAGRDSCKSALAGRLIYLTLKCHALEKKEKKITVLRDQQSNRTDGYVGDKRALKTVVGQLTKEVGELVAVTGANASVIRDLQMRLKHAERREGVTAPGVDQSMQTDPWSLVDKHKTGHPIKARPCV
jgi:hypothetical protein